MGSKQLRECTFLIPLRRDKELSDGKQHTVTAWRWLQGELYERFQGWTIAPGVYEGQWKSSQTGESVSDRSRMYIVALPKRDLPALRRLLREACRTFYQQRIYLSIAGQVEFVEAPRDGTKE
jgi:hypothetical protein